MRKTDYKLIKHEPVLGKQKFPILSYGMKLILNSEHITLEATEEIKTDEEAYFRWHNVRKEHFYLLRS